MTTTKSDCEISQELFAKAQALFEANGARRLASAVLSLAVKRRVGLSIDDLPDIPCGMYFRDEWQETWGEVGLTKENLVFALSDAYEVVDEILREEGFEG